jgi:jumonji domain-containing protein 2
MGTYAVPEVQAPVFHPTKAEFSQPFCTYVKKILKKHPDLPMFKVVPPPGWSPRK